MTVLAAASASAEHTQTLLAIVISAIGIVTAILGVGRWVVRRYLEPNRRMVEEWTGDPGQPAKGIQPRPGALERITALESAVGTVRGAVTRNGGSSMADAVARVEANQGVTPT